MKVFRMADVEKIEKMLADGKTVVVERQHRNFFTQTTRK